MDISWITTGWGTAFHAVLSATGIYLAVIAFTRMAGLRSFSKMSSFDFAMTVAVGSVIASTTLSQDVPLLLGVASLGALFAVQELIAHIRVWHPPTSSVIDNRPLLLMKDGEMLQDAMRTAEITRADLLAKLREANVLQLEQARAVVLETTGDISVLHAPPGSDMGVADVLLEDVRTT
jgi:uncharacterized membrane protein YcaP (DUF421 family)